MNQLVKFLEENDGKYPTQSSDSSLKGWVQFNRKKFKAKALSAEKVARLNAIGFIWESKDSAWLEQFEKWKQLSVQDRRNDMNKWELKQKEYQRNWANGKTSGGKTRRSDDGLAVTASTRRKLLEDEGFDFSIRRQKRHSTTLLPEQYCANKSHLVCLRKLMEEYDKMNVDERNSCMEHCQLLEKKYDETMKDEEDDKSQYYREWKQENAKIKEQGKSQDQTTEAYWTGETKPSMPQVWPQGFVFDRKSRVLTVDHKRVNKSDGQLFWQCLERDDIAVVTEGLGELTEGLWTLEYITKMLPEDHEHGSFQEFKVEKGSVTETTIPMTCGEFSRRVKRGDKLYMSDLPVDLIPRSKAEFGKVMELMMPGGPNCLMRDVSENCGYPLVLIVLFP